MTKIRTFIAIAVSPEVRSRAAQLTAKLALTDAKVKWVDPENMHLTVKFLGDVDETMVADVCRRVITAAAGHQPFPAACHGVGAFPNVSRPRTIWIGVREGTDELIELHRAIDRTLAELGFPKEGRRFHPHLTIGRLRGGDGRPLGNLIRENAEAEAGRFRVEEVLVFSSQLQPSGPEYAILGRAPLASSGLST